MDFENDLRNEILKKLPRDKYNVAETIALTTKRTDDLLITFLNWSNRLVHPHARIVHLSTELKASAAFVKHKTDLDEIIKKIVNGTNITPHLSKLIEYGYTQPSGSKNLNARKDMDMLLNDWGIHHLHLSNVIEPDGFMKRDGPLLFAIFTQTDAYLIDVLGHSDWTNQHLVEVAVRNWPGANLFLRSNALLPGKQPMSAMVRKRLRGNAYTTMIEIGGAVYIPRTLGITGTGSSTRTTREAHSILTQLRDIEIQLKLNPDLPKPTFEQAGKELPPLPAYRLVLTDGPTGYQFAILEEISGLTFGITWRPGPNVAKSSRARTKL